MARYDYVCLDCKKLAEQVKGSELIGDEILEVVYETAHPMEPTPVELKSALICPRCNGGNAERYWRGVGDIVCYIRGNGYLDKAGCHRDMNLFKLTTEDPYAELREPGEADDLKERLQRGGQYNPNTQYFTATPADNTVDD